MQAAAPSRLISISPGSSQSRPTPRTPSWPGKPSLQPKTLDSCTSSSTTRSTNAHRFLSRIRAEPLLLGPPQHHDTPYSSPGGRSAPKYLEKPQHASPTYSPTAPSARGGAICGTSHLTSSHPSACRRLTQDLTTQLPPSTGPSAPLRWGWQGGMQVKPFSNFSCIPVGSCGNFCHVACQSVLLLICPPRAQRS